MFSGVLKRCVSDEKELYVGAKKTCLANQQSISHMRFCLRMTLEPVLVSALLFTNLSIPQRRTLTNRNRKYTWQYLDDD